MFSIVNVIHFRHLNQIPRLYADNTGSCLLPLQGTHEKETGEEKKAWQESEGRKRRLCRKASGADEQKTALFQVKAISIHDFGPGFDEILNKLFLVVILRIHFSVGTQDGV